MNYKPFKHVSLGEAEKMRDMYFKENQSVYMISKATGRAYKTIIFWLSKYGKIRDWSEAQLLANRLGRGQGTKNKQINNPMWKGGKNRTCYGYILIWLARDDPFYCMANALGYVREHRHIVAQHLNRPLIYNEIVHHLNGIKSDNRLVNLVLVNRSNHPTKTLMNSLQKRIRKLEGGLSQQKLNI